MRMRPAMPRRQPDCQIRVGRSCSSKDVRRYYEKAGSGRALGECHGVAEGSEAFGVIPRPGQSLVFLS